MIPTQIQGQVPLNYNPMMIPMQMQQPGYPMGIPTMMIQQVRPPMGMFPAQMYPNQVPNPQNLIMDQFNNMQLGNRPFTQGGNPQNK